MFMVIVLSKSNSVASPVPGGAPPGVWKNYAGNKEKVPEISWEAVLADSLPGGGPLSLLTLPAIEPLRL
jgi:hypothetical protein